MRLSTNLFCFLTLFILGFTGLNCAQAQDGASKEDDAERSKVDAAEDVSKGDTYEYALMKTDKGDIVLRLNATLAPLSTANFLSYAKDGAYNDTIFHRVIDGFMIQGGGFTADMQQKPTQAPIENEANNGLQNQRGTIAMARTQDPHSATAQFFINVQDNDFLNHTGENMQGWGYAVFGKVTDGEAVLDKIRAVQTCNQGGHQDVPVEPIIIESVAIITD